MRTVILLTTALLATSACAAAWAVTDPPMPAPHRQAAPALPATLAQARLATAKYVTGLRAARADGYRIITKMIPDMGFHFMNPGVTGFEPTKPPILVYERRGGTWQLGALEWVFLSKPKQPPLPGARYGSFAAACHYADGTFVLQDDEHACAPTAPGSGAKFTFWHPDLVTLHLWLWYPNPEGVFNSTTRLVVPFERGL
jgi:hypothetical protein